MTDFGLVHGAYHGAWCWERLTPELERLGHRVFTVDLPAEDPRAGAAEYAAASVTAFADAGEDLVLVGHSLGGLTIPLIAASRPVRQLIFLAAMIPRPGETHDEVMAAEPDMVLPGPEGGAYRGSDGAVRWRPEAAASWFYADCPAELAAWAAARMRGQFWTITSEISPLTAWPGTPCAYLLGAHDPVINPAWSRSAARTVLGVQPVELDVGHAPFLAAPALLARVLIEVSTDPGTGSQVDLPGRLLTHGGRSHGEAAGRWGSLCHWCWRRDVRVRRGRRARRPRLRCPDPVSPRDRLPAAQVEEYIAVPGPQALRVCATGADNPICNGL